MKLILILAAAASLSAPAVFAQAPGGPPAQAPGQAAAKAPGAGHDHPAMSPAQMHEHCKATMGHKMDPKAPHEHSRDKSGISAGPKKPLSEAEMKKMHDACVARMTSDK